MRSVFPISAVILLTCATLCGQSIEPQTFHIHGTIKDGGGSKLEGARVVFQNDQLSKVLITNDSGVYEANIPLGDYTMTVQEVGFRPYRRPLFRVAAPTDLDFEATLRPYESCDVLVFNDSGKVTPDEWAAAQQESCLQEDFIPVPYQGSPFRLYVRYGNRTATGNVSSYAGENANQHAMSVFVTYNLFTMQADRVIYNSKAGTLEATGNIVVVNEPGTIQRADALTFKIKNGEATRTPRPQIFHVKGMITDEDGGVIPSPTISLQSPQFDKTMKADNAGIFEADLPLGDYTMSAKSWHMKTYHKVHFRATSPTTITVNGTEYQMRTSCDLMVRPEQWEEAAKEVCGGEDFYPVPSGDRGTPLQVDIQYGERARAKDGFSYGGYKDAGGGTLTPVFVEYNRFFLHADRVFYDINNHTITAGANVVVEDGRGAPKRAKTMTFKLENGKATLLPR